MRHKGLLTWLAAAATSVVQAHDLSPLDCDNHPVCRITIVTVLFGPTTLAPANYVTVTEPCNACKPSKATRTILPNGDAPGTIIVYTSAPGSAAGDYATITKAYTGPGKIREPVTTTVAVPEGDQPGTVIVETGDYVTITEQAPFPIDTPNTTTIAQPSGDEPGTAIVQDPRPPLQAPVPIEEPTTSSEQPGPTFSCDAGGFLIQQNTLYRLNLATGENPVVKKTVGDGGNINALGYNVLDNFLYAFISIGNNRQQLIRIDANGDSTLLPLVVPGGLNVGDIDENGQFWVSARGSRWAQVDLKPGSSTFGQVKEEGTSPGFQVADWVYLENGGDYLYSIKLGEAETAGRWSRTTHKWEALADYAGDGPVRKGFGALYAVGDELWGSDNQSGDILAFPVLKTGATARKITDGPATDSNDGARCFKAPPP